VQLVGYILIKLNYCTVKTWKKIFNDCIVLYYKIDVATVIYITQLMFVFDIKGLQVVY